MDTYDARALAKALMAEHGLIEQGWALMLDINADRLYGQCRFREKRIRLNPDFVRRNNVINVRDLILHEIAHALVGPGHGHNKVFYSMCRRIGARPERFHTMAHIRPSRRRTRRGVTARQAPTTDNWLRSAPARVATARRKLRETRIAYADSLRQAVRDVRGAAEANNEVFSRPFKRLAWPCRSSGTKRTGGAFGSMRRSTGRVAGRPSPVMFSGQHPPTTHIVVP
jgi:hypothetical protein